MPLAPKLLRLLRFLRPVRVVSVLVSREAGRSSPAWPVWAPGLGADEDVVTSRPGVVNTQKGHLG